MVGSYPAGTAPIKAECIISAEPRAVPDDDSAEGATSHVGGGSYGASQNLPDEEKTDASAAPPAKLTGAQRRKQSREEKKKRQGANKGRRFGKVRDDLDLCWKIAGGGGCEFGSECRFTHDVAAYLAQKPRDIKFPPQTALIDAPPFIQHAAALQHANENVPWDPSTTCPVFDEKGECRHGLKCRFLGGHVRRDESGVLEIVRDDDKVARRKVETSEVNYVGTEALKLLRSRKYPRPIADAYLRELQIRDDDGKEVHEEKDEKKISMAIDPPSGPDVAQGSVNGDGNDPEKLSSASHRLSETVHDDQKDTPDVPVRFSEKKRLRWEGKTYLAPLTTVGNLPFRRLCVSMGADITCGEMGLATSFLQGSKEEWSLVRRHPSESVFGVQLAGNKPGTLVPIAEVMAKEFAGNVDFVDVNCGCPIDLVFKSGSGSALLDTPGKLGKILIGMNKALGEIPLTVKLRTGVKDGRNTAHKLMPRLGSEWGVGAVTLHGRTRQQRYTKLADWDYIKQCTEAVRARAADEDLPPIPVFGGGDCFSSESYWSCVEQSGVDGVMVGRGALIKPWIFTEIQERREWDISSRERLELIRKYADYGLNHFGSDTTGVNTTRRYLCESLSFQHRYIPIGLLEVLPGRLNDRAPAFRGRDELETLLASPDSRDWVKVSEFFLGPAPESWNFTPKHKSNAYGVEEGQG